MSGFFEGGLDLRRGFTCQDNGRGVPVDRLGKRLKWDVLVSPAEDEYNFFSFRKGIDSRYGSGRTGVDRAVIKLYASFFPDKFNAVLNALEDPRSLPHNFRRNPSVYGAAGRHIIFDVMSSGQYDLVCVK